MPEVKAAASARTAVLEASGNPFRIATKEGVAVGWRANCCAACWSSNENWSALTLIIKLFNLLSLARPSADHRILQCFHGYVFCVDLALNLAVAGFQFPQEYRV